MIGVQNQFQHIEQTNENIYLTSGNGNFIKIKNQIGKSKLNYQTISTNIENNLQRAIMIHIFIS